MSSPLFSKIIHNYNNLKYVLFHAQEFDPNHYGFQPIYYDIMTSDSQRINAFRAAFQ